MAVRNDELRDFLRTRRARLRPGDVGLPVGDGRRVPGLRREELAVLAGVSVDYYIRLEQGRGHNVSPSVLDAVAGALKLDQAEHQHLVDLARSPSGPRLAPAPGQQVRPAVVALVAGLDPRPAFVIGERMDVLESNWMARQLMGGWPATPPDGRNLARFVFLDERARYVLPEWAAAAEETVAMLRLYTGRRPDDPQLTRLVGELSRRSPDFVRFWAAHDVRSRASGVKQYRHPELGEITVSFEVLDFPGDEGQRLCVNSAEPGSPSEHALLRLAAMRPPRPKADASA